jgi:hypothetical protein
MAWRIFGPKAMDRPKNALRSKYLNAPAYYANTAGDLVFASGEVLNMKRQIRAIYILIAFSLSAFAQSNSDTRPLSQLKNDYNQVAIVAHLKIRSIKFAAQDVHPLYVVQGEVIEPFKGKLKRGQRLEFYIHVEEDYDVNRFLGERILFLEGKYPIPSGGKGWYVLENSSLQPSARNISSMRKIKNARKRV